MPTNDPRITSRPIFTPRFIVMLSSGLATFALVAAMLSLPVPYAVQGAGPTFDTLMGYNDDGDAGDGDNDNDDGDAGDGDDEGEDEVVTLINVEDTETYPTDGQLRLTTVETSGGPGFEVRAPNVIFGYWSSNQRVMPVEAVFAPDETREERDARSAAQMATSQEHAIVSALTELDYEVPLTLEIVGADPAGGSAGIVEEGDEILAIEVPDEPRRDIVTYADLSGPLAATPAESTATLFVQRDGEEQALEIVTTDDGRGGSLLGIFLDADIDVPIDVQIAIDNVGGPSAGVMFALGLIDVLTPDDLTGGQVIAGTGTIGLDGRVGAIGGVDLKMRGAVRDGATHFIAPTANCNEVVGNIPSGLQVAAVDTLAEAREVVEQIAQDPDAQVPGCPAQ